MLLLTLSENQRVAHYTIHSLVDHYGSLFYLKSSYKTIHSAQRHSACSPQVLELMKEVTEEEDDENISSDISGELYFVVARGQYYSNCFWKLIAFFIFAKN